MVWQLWKTAALLIVLLGITGKVAGFSGPDTADISIIGGNEVNIGDKVVIQCSYTGGPAASNPYFTINGDDFEPHNLETELSDYEHNYYVTIISSGCAATYNLTLPAVSVEYNGTTYQCYIKLSNKEEKSGTVTLIVRDPATGGTTTDEEGTDGADPSQSSSTTAATLVSNTHATTSIVMATTLMSGVSDTSKTVPTLDSSTQPVYSVATMSPTTTHVTMATTAPSLNVSKVIGVTSRVAITTNVAMTTGTVTVTPSSSNSELNSSKTVPTLDSSTQSVYSAATMSPTTTHVTMATTAPSLNASKVIGVTSRVAITTNVAMTTSVAMTTGTVTVMPTSNSELHSSKATSFRTSATQTTQPSPTAEAANPVSDKMTIPSADPPTDPATGGTTTDEEVTDGADPSQTSSTTAATLLTSLRASATQTTQPSPTTEAANQPTTPSAHPPTDAPSYINVVIGSITAVAMYLLTIILIGVVIHFGVKAKKNRSKAHHFPTHSPPPPPSAPPIEMTHNPVYGGAAAPPAYVEHIDFGENRNVLVNMDVMYHDVNGRKSMVVESLYDYVQ